MNETGFWRRIDRVIRWLAPFATSVLFLVLAAIPLPIPGYQSIAPALALTAVYYWSIFRPDLMPAPAVFVVGILEDAHTGAPLGTNSLVFLVVSASVFRQRRVVLGKPFAVMWWGFGLTAAGAVLASWFIASLLSDRMLPPGPALMHYLMTLAVFPAFAWVLLRMHRAFLTAA
ncbi:MAG: rod shape-determining protein MreD [Alphaproteobacteria bacterium]